MNVYKRVLCLMLALVLCMGVFVGCGDTNDNPDPKDTETDSKEVEASGTGNGGNDGGEDPSDTEETLDPKYVSDLEQNYDFGGPQEFVLLARDDTKYEYVSDGIDGDTVSAAVFERNEEVMERCNIELTVVPEIGDWDNREGFMTVVRNNALSPVSEYDLISTHEAYLMTLSLEGIGVDLADAPAIDFSKRWWSEPFYRDCSYNDSIYIMIGDIGYTLYEHIEVIFFNETMAEDLELEDLYETALDGDWTWELFKEYTTMVTTDIDAAPDTIKYGYLSSPHAERSFPTAFGVQFAQKGNDGKYTFPLFMTDPTLTMMDNLVKFTLETPQVKYVQEYSTGAESQNPVFSSGRALFYGQMLDEAMFFKTEMSDGYGVLPFPKYSDNQVEYYTTVCDNLNAILIPKNVKNLDMSGVVTEMLSVIGYDTITQEYYEEAMKYQAFDNPDCVETLELIRTSLTMTFTMAYSFYLGYPNSVISGLIYNGGGVNVGTQYAANSKAYATSCKELYAFLDSMIEGVPAE